MAGTIHRLSRKQIEDALRGKAKPGRMADGNNLYLVVSRDRRPYWAAIKQVDGRRVQKALGAVAALGMDAGSTDLGRIAAASMKAARLACAAWHMALRDGATIQSLRKKKVTEAGDISFDWSAVADTYRKMKGPLTIIAERMLVRNIRNFKASIPEVDDVRSLEKSHARRWRDDRVAAKASPQTIDRELSLLRAALNLFFNEQNLKLDNPFSGLIIAGRATKGSGKNKRAREPFTIGEIHALRKVCYDTSKTPDLGAMFDVIVMTGARLSEVSKLQPADIFLAHEIPHIRIRATEERGVKTEGSERLVPVYGLGFVALMNAMQRNKKSGWVFGRTIGEQNPSSTSAILGKKKDKVTDNPKKAGAHSCRHSISDVLKAALVPKELRDAMTGHVSGQDIAENTYGSISAQLVAMDAAMRAVLNRYSANIIANNDPADSMAVQTLEEFFG